MKQAWPATAAIFNPGEIIAVWVEYIGGGLF